MAFENWNDMKVGDVIECYRVESVQRSAVTFYNHLGRLYAGPSTPVAEIDN